MKELSRNLERRRPSLLRMLAPRFADPNVISFAAGYPSAESFPAGELAEIARDVLLNDTVTALQYAPSSGFPCFINAALEHYVKPYKRLDNLSPDKVLVATGSTQAFEAIINTLFNPGDVVLVENPTFGGTTSQLDVARVDMVGVDADGVIIEDLEAKIKEYKPKAFYVIPTFQNPTGRTLSLERRKKVAELAAQYDMYVIEDDPYSDLRFTGEALPPIKYFDKGDRVILVCSFSKVLSPGMRLALMIPPAELYDALYYIKSCTDLHTPSLTQLVAAEFLNRGLLDGQIEKVIAMYKDRWEKMERAMRKYFPSELKWVDTKGGMFTWLSLPTPSKDCDSIKMLGDCLDSCGVAYMPTASFYINPEDGNNTIRLNFTSAPYERIEEGIEKLGGFLKNEIAKH